MNKDKENESIGIIAVIIIVILAAIGLYYFFSHHTPAAINVKGHTVPVEAPSPIKEGSK